MYVYVCVYLARFFSCKHVWSNKTDTLFLPLLKVDSLKSSYESFDIWMEYILKKAQFFHKSLTTPAGAIFIT